MGKREYVLDGSAFSTLEEFAHYFSKTVLDGHEWRGNLDAFNDILRGGFGTPDEGFVLRWKNHDLSRERLGHQETARRLERLLTTCHPSNVPGIQRRLSLAESGVGPTLFDEIVEIVRNHGPGGKGSRDAVDLVLE